jgi:electron transfer flavoprotein beta subunit
MKIAVLVAPAVHPVTPVPAEADLAALALAQRPPGQLQVWYAGAADDAALADYLARGADNIHSLSLSPTDRPRWARPLQGFDMVLCGARSGGGDGSGLLPYHWPSNWLRPCCRMCWTCPIRPAMAGATGAAQGRARTLQASLPLVASVSPRAATAPGWVTPGCRARFCAKPPLARLWPRWCWNPPVVRVRWWPPARSAAMPACRVPLPGDAKAAGVVVKQGDSVEKAQVVLDYLRQHQLVDF